MEHNVRMQQNYVSHIFRRHPTKNQHGRPQKKLSSPALRNHLPHMVRRRPETNRRERPHAIIISLIPATILSTWSSSPSSLHVSQPTVNKLARTASHHHHLAIYAHYLNLLFPSLRSIPTVSFLFCLSYLLYPQMEENIFQSAV